MSRERDNPGVFHQLSESYARASQGTGNAAHAVRLGARFASKNSARSWLAVLQQANRLARAMTEDKLASNRPQLRSATLPVLDQVEKIVRAEVMRVREEAAGEEKAAVKPQRREEIPMSVHRPQPGGADRGYGR